MSVSTGEVVKGVATHIIGDDVTSQSVWYWLAVLDEAVDFATVLAAMIAKVEAIYDDIKSYVHQSTYLSDLIAHIWEWNAGESKWETGDLIGLDALSDTFEGTVTAFPNQVAGTMTAFSQDVNARARKSFGGLIETFATENEVTGAPFTAMAAAMVEWLTPITIAAGKTLYPCVATKYGAALPLLFGLISGLAGTQRQRKPGEGI